MLKRSIAEHPHIYIITFLSLIVSALLLYSRKADPLVVASVLSLGAAALSSIKLRKQATSYALLTLSLIAIFVLSISLAMSLFDFLTISGSYNTPVGLLTRKSWVIGAVISGLLIIVLLSSLQRSTKTKQDVGIFDVIFLLLPIFYIVYLLYYIGYLFYQLANYDWLYATGILYILGFIIFAIALGWRWRLYSGFFSPKQLYRNDVLTIHNRLVRSAGLPSILLAVTRLMILWILWMPVVDKFGELGRKSWLYILALYTILELVIIYYRMKSAHNAFRYIGSDSRIQKP